MNLRDRALRQQQRINELDGKVLRLQVELSVAEDELRRAEEELEHVIGPFCRVG